MFSPRQALLSAALCAALTAPTQGSAPDEGKSTNSNTYSTAPAAPAAPWDIEASNAAKIANKDTSLMSLPIWPLQQLCQIFVDNDCPEAILALGLTSSHLTGNLMGWKYPDPCQDEDTRINNPTIQQAIWVDLRNAINAREEAFMTLQKASETQPEAKPKPKARLLAPWKELLGEKAPLNHLIRALKMLSPQNVERLGKRGLLRQLAARNDKVKTLALGASAVQIFTEKMDGDDQAWIIEGALASSRPLSEYAALGSACHRLFTENMDGPDQGVIIRAALESSRPLSEYAALGAACKEHLFMDGMDGEKHSWIIRAALLSSCPLSEYAALGAACKEHLFMENMNKWDQARVIRAALNSSRPLSEYAALGAACKQHLFTEGMDGGGQVQIISATIPLSDTQMDQLVREYAATSFEDKYGRKDFICKKAEQLLAGK